MKANQIPDVQQNLIIDAAFVRKRILNTILDFSWSLWREGKIVEV